ncbi:MAG: hypothetical protein GTO03_07585, partial [Planctomycetales bacterium]|nr:hypothetical protein [Planctomycetales bacterium]
ALYRQEVTGRDASLWPQKIQYTDYVAWQEQMLAGEQGRRQGEYWMQQLNGELPQLDLPTDRPRPPVQTFRGRSYHFDLPAELAGGLIELARQQGTTLF